MEKLLSRTTTAKFNFRTIKNFDMKTAVPWVMAGVAELKGRRTALVGFAGNRLFLPKHPQAIKVTHGNLEWACGGKYDGVHWAAGMYLAKKK